MSQILTFGKAVEQLYFNVDVKKASPESIITDFGKVAQEYRVSKEMSSLSVNLSMKVNGDAKLISHFFKFIKSPLPDTTIDSGYIKVSIGEVDNSKIIIDIDWCFSFLRKEDAEAFFEELKKMFAPLSTKQRFENDKLNFGKYAEFSTRKDNETGIRDVTFSLSKSINGDKYEIRLIPYNEFAE